MEGNGLTISLYAIIDFIAAIDVVSIDLTLLDRHFFWLWHKWVYQSVQRCIGLTHHVIFWHSGSLALSPECQKIRKKTNIYCNYGSQEAKLVKHRLHEWTVLERVG